MKRKIAVFALMLCWLASCLSVQAAPKFAYQIQVQDENGKSLLKTQGILLSASRPGIPSLAYQKLGMFRRVETARRRVTVGMPSSDVGSIFVERGQKILDFLHEKPIPRPYKRPVIRFMDGRDYIASDVIKESYSDVFTSAYNSSTRTITLRRTKQFADIRKMLD
jgi:hypothetical protein